MGDSAPVPGTAAGVGREREQGAAPNEHRRTEWAEPGAVDDELTDAIWDYLNVGAHKHGHQRTAERFGVSRQTLWRFLERDQDDRRLPRAALDSVGNSVEALVRVTDSLIAESPSRNRRRSTGALSGRLRTALLGLCEAPLTTAGELAQLSRVPASTLREQLARLSERGLADSVIRSGMTRRGATADR